MRAEYAVSLAWPGWWTDEAERSASARAELRFTLARKLGLDAHALLEDEPRFIWKTGSFKNLTAATDLEREALLSYGTSIARALLSGTSPPSAATDLRASTIRESLLSHTVFITLGDLLSLCWALGIPVIHLKVFPLTAKRMCAMTVKVRDRFAILLAKDSKSPAPIAYYLAHELGHIALGHLDANPALVDIADPLRSPRTDPEEVAADRYALEVLTGDPSPLIGTENDTYSAAGLAQAARGSANELHIEPGTIILCFGHATQRWDKAMAALKYVYPNAHDVSVFVNRVAVQQLAEGDASEENADFVRAAMGLADE